MNYTKGEWRAGYNPGVTGPTTPSIEPFCGGRDWAYRTVNIGMETIAIIPEQIKGGTVGYPGELIKGSAEANANLIAAAPDMYETLKEISEGKGAYSMDRLTHAENTIRDMKALAIEALVKAEGK